MNLADLRPNRFDVVVGARRGRDPSPWGRMLRGRQRPSVSGHALIADVCVRSSLADPGPALTILNRYHRQRTSPGLVGLSTELCAQLISEELHAERTRNFAQAAGLSSSEQRFCVRVAGVLHLRQGGYREHNPVFIHAQPENATLVCGLIFAVKELGAVRRGEWGEHTEAHCRACEQWAREKTEQHWEEAGLQAALADLRESYNYSPLGASASAVLVAETARDMSRLLLAKLALAEVSAQQLRTLLSETLMPNFYAHANSRAGRERNDHTLRRALGANRYADLVRWARTREFYVEESPLGGIVEWPPLLAKVYALAPDPSDELRWRCIRADHADRISNAVHAALAPVRPGA